MIGPHLAGAHVNNNHDRAMFLPCSKYLTIYLFDCWIFRATLRDYKGATTLCDAWSCSPQPPLAPIAPQRLRRSSRDAAGQRHDLAVRSNHEIPKNDCRSANVTQFFGRKYHIHVEVNAFFCEMSILPAKRFITVKRQGWRPGRPQRCSSAAASLAPLLCCCNDACAHRPSVNAGLPVVLLPSFFLSFYGDCPV